VRSFENRLRKIEEALAAKPKQGFDLNRALSFCVAGIPRCVAQAKRILFLNHYAKEGYATDEEIERCYQRIAAMAPAFSSETSRDLADNPNFHEDEHRPLLDAAWKIIRELPDPEVSQ
jgi:hypothetical protein